MEWSILLRLKIGAFSSLRILYLSVRPEYLFKVIMFATAIRYIAKKPKPKMKPIEVKTSPEQTQTITRVIFDILKEHGPLTIADTWERVKEVGLRGLTSKRQMKIVLRWMRERQKVRQICNHVGPQKQFLYTTWFTKPNIRQSSRPKFP
ncbi:uncharacterized protein LOC127803429 [Diospyros lotus]|uniref:uncharacterized protein LOC127803429 n=1 Tax=Diospyros lotus TaxID=55363 RepID=UPI002255AF4F|nr:uncharacterized protein LOC127803429 [Diospyros lotus]